MGESRVQWPPGDQGMPMAMSSGTDLLRIEDLGISFAILGGPIQAVARPACACCPGKVTALVGESGSGKSVISQAIMGILPRTAHVPAAASCSPTRTTGKTTDICSCRATARRSARCAAAASA